MPSLRRAFNVALATCGVLWLVAGLAIAQTPSSATKKPAVGLSAKKINFGKMPAGTQSNPQTVTLTNKSSVDLAAPLVTVTGTGFVLDSNGCVSTLHPTDSCPVSVKFAPPSKGKFKHGLLKFTDQGAKSPQKVKLTGIGLAASPTATPTRTATATASPTATATPTATASRTATPSVTASATATATATATRTATATASSTATPTATKTATATSTSTSSETATASRTATSTATATATLTPTATATSTATASATPTATATPVFNVVFVSSATYDGSINGTTGLAGADAACASLASAAHLPTGTYTAWLSTSTVFASTRLGSARGFVRVDGAPIADQVSDIAGNGTMLNSIDIDENGNPISAADVWTGTTVFGTSDFFLCSDWTTNSNSSEGNVGLTTGGATLWTKFSADQCNSAHHLYCFDDSHVTQLTIAPAAGRVAFVSAGLFDTTSGVSGADTLCQTEATSAGLKGASTFRALLSTSTVSAADPTRFDFSMGSMPYVRPDGIEIADAPSIAGGSALGSGIWQHADGTYLQELNSTVLWTGSPTPNVTGTTSSTCNDWSSKSSSDFGSRGRTVSDPNWWDANSAQPCTATASVYCLEQ